MAYKVYINKNLMPVTPGKISMKIKNRNKTIDLINEGEVNMLRSPGLTDISMELQLPSNKYSWATYDNGYKPAHKYLAIFEKLKTGKKSFPLVIARSNFGGVGLHGTSIVVTLEDYDIADNVEEGIDTIVSLNFKQFVSYGTKKLVVKKKKATASSKKKTKAKKKSTNTRATKKSKATTYTVKKGDCLWNISKKFLNNGGRWKEIYNLNKSIIKNPELIYPGQKFKIPAA
jgi:LysM repeat protein